jgi:hypothetical protein
MTSPTPTDENPATHADNGGSDQQAQLEAAFSGAASGNSQETAPIPPARPPGKRGPDKKPRKKPGVSVGEVDNGTDSPLFTGAVPRLAEPDFEPVRPPIDDASRRAGVAGLVKVVETAVVVFVESKARQKYSQPEVIERYTTAARPPGDVREMLINGGTECWKKYFPDVPIGPEVELAAGFVLWGNAIRELINDLKSKPDVQTQAA